MGSMNYFFNKGIDDISISNILNRKEVVKEIPPYFKNQSVPIVSYSYTNSIGRKIFNYKEALQDINIEEKDATSHIILDNLYLGEKGSTPPLSSSKSLRSLR
jgi:hypothetical protein